MSPISCARHQFPPVIIQHAVRLRLRFTLSYRDVEDLLAERGLEVSYETVQGDPHLSLTVSDDLNGCMPTLQTAGAAWQPLDEADGETAADAGD